LSWIGWEELDIYQMPPDYSPGAFDCGKGDMNDYLLDGSAHADCASNFAQTWLTRHDGLVIGYVTALADAIQLDEKERPAGVRYTTAPALKLGRLAVCESHAGRGVGTHLVNHVVGMARSLSALAGCRYVTLDAHPDKIGWYERQDFVKNEVHPAAVKAILKLVRHIKHPRAPENVSMRLDILLDAERTKATISRS
jgi:GNAT superfamily N-acetyltransferase